MKQVKAHGKQQQVRQVKVHGSLGKKGLRDGRFLPCFSELQASGVYVNPRGEDDHERGEKDCRRDVEEDAVSEKIRFIAAAGA
jgi:hypothetical protein